MEIFGIDVWGLITNPIGAVAATSTSIILFQGWKVLNSMFRPVSYVAKLYDMADHVVEQIDNNLVDKIRSKKIKADYVL